MATRNRTSVERPRQSNPIAHVAYQARDLTGIEAAGGSSTELVPVTPQLRRTLQLAVTAAENIIAAEASAHADVPGVMIIRLRNEAIAKSHRPIELITEASIAPAGHGELNEMLIAVNPVNLQQLRNVIGERNTKKLRANISAIESFLPWDAARRLPPHYRHLPLQDAFGALQQTGRRLLVRLFEHAAADTTQTIVERFERILAQHRITFVRLEQRTGSPVYALEFNQALTDQLFYELVRFQGVRHIRPEPLIHTAATAAIGGAALPAPLFNPAPPAPGLPVVAVFDTGIDPTSPQMAPWVASRDTYVLPPDTNYVHGTAVGSLLASCVTLNSGHAMLPQAPCVIHDVCALESGPFGSLQTDLIVRLREALRRRPDIKVWNLSLGGQIISDDEFSDFARELDALSDAYSVLFIVAAGNYVIEPRRGWPVNSTVFYADRLSSPGDSVRCLTIGAVTHLDSAASLVRAAEPASYSRRGPGPVFTPKPDIVHVGGNTDAHFNCDGIGLNVLAPGGLIPAGCGTSYAAPLAAAIAAHTWHKLSLPERVHELTVSPTLVKVLMVHSAQLNSPEREPALRRYFGSGIPADPIAVLYDADDSFTVLFELDIVDRTKWRKMNYPIPPSLLHEEKFRGEIIVTAGYAAPLNSVAGAEYVRFNVDVGFGTFAPNENGDYGFRSRVPAEGEVGTGGFEEAQVEHGGKWSPMKIYRRQFPLGAKGTNWGLQATILRRALEPQLAQPLRVIIAVTLRSLDGNRAVYQEGRRLLEARNWLSQNLSQPVDVQIRA